VLEEEELVLDIKLSCEEYINYDHLSFYKMRRTMRLLG